MTKAKAIYSDRDYLEARFSSTDEKLDTVIQLVQSAITKADSAHTHAEASHTRITKYENRFIGWVIGIGGLGAAGGMTLGETVKSLFRGIGGH